MKPEGQVGAPTPYIIPKEVEASVREAFLKLEGGGLSKSDWMKLQTELDARVAREPEAKLALLRLQYPDGSGQIDVVEQECLREQKRRVEAESMHQQEERESGLPKNLLTHLEDVRRAMAILEGVEWLDLQDRGSESGVDIASALKWLQTRGTTSTVIYGSGGGHRYDIYPDGEVRYSAYHSNNEDTERARRLGFKIS